MEPRWTSGAKDAVGTAYAIASKVWFTTVKGCLSEIYYPTIDAPQIRDLQFLVTDGATFFHEERRSLTPEVSPLHSESLGVSVIMRDPKGRYAIHKEIITDPYQNCLLVDTKISGDPEFLKKLKLFVLCAPHLAIGGWHNNAEVVDIHERRVLSAFKENVHMALAATTPFARCSAGYVGASDGWQDLKQNLAMDWEFDYAPDGNTALMGEIDLSKGMHFTLGVAFGETRQNAFTTLMQSISMPFEMVRGRFLAQWQRTKKRLQVGECEPEHQQRLYALSVNLLLAHEDKTYPGAMIASLSIPWGDMKGDEELGGYHLVWSRDMCHSATALMSVDDYATPLRGLIYLAVSQRDDGGFYQNFWIDGRPYWKGIQLDESAFPIVLAWRLWQAKALGNFDPRTMVRRATSFLLREGPMTNQERWEENSGYSPSTLAAVIAGLICGAEFLRAEGNAESAQFVEEYADFLENNIERWTVTTEGTVHPEIKTHYERINPKRYDAEGYTDEDPNTGWLRMANRAPGTKVDFEAKDIVDAGFLELVRYGIRRAGSELMENSLRVVDRVLKVETPAGPVWHRYNHDGYGQRDDGTGYQHWGTGRAWPLLTGERAHYELAAGRDAVPLMKAMEGFTTGIGLFPEQVWDSPQSPHPRLKLGKPTPSAIPLAWAHGEYLKLVRSIAMGKPFDRIEPVYARYCGAKRPVSNMEAWTLARKPRFIPAGKTLRILLGQEFMVKWTVDDWKTSTETNSSTNELDVFFADVATSARQSAPIRFKLLWKCSGEWEHGEFTVTPRAAEERNARSVSAD
jgi:glucoamylase